MPTRIKKLLDNLDNVDNVDNVDTKTKSFSRSHSVKSFVKNGTTYTNVKTKTENNIDGKHSAIRRDIYKVGDNTYEEIQNKDGTLKINGDESVKNTVSGYLRPKNQKHKYYLDKQ